MASVYKFGGQSIANYDRIQRCLDIIEAAADKGVVVVVSAHGDTTDRLLRAARSALEGNTDISDIRKYHMELIDALIVPSGLIEPLLVKLETLLHGVWLLKELTPRTLDHIISFGERLASRIISGALVTRGRNSVAINSYDVGMITDDHFGSASPLHGIETGLGEAFAKIEGIPVVTGFLGKNSRGEITTLGRSGSDFSATIIAAGIGASEVVIWKNVDGVMTADPSVDPRARNIPELSFDEASELAYFGAEVLHPSTLIPAIKKGIPVRVVNAFKENDLGTSIFAEPVITKSIAKSVAYKEDVTLFHLSSQRLHSVPDVLNSALAALKKLGIVAHMVTTSEAGISLITQSDLSDEQKMEATEALKRIAPVSSYPAMAIVCIVGDELKGRADAIGKIFTSLGEVGINAKAITKGASEINIGVLIKNEDIPKAVRALHGLILAR
ncbi:MAG: aspartate kinase [Candidatus Riflebacteria bacterium]|nr:aspartate kinase [Candidatus Riflebacteria bacterium]